MPGFYTRAKMVWGPGGAALVLLLRGARHRDPVGWWLILVPARRVWGLMLANAFSIENR